MMVEIPRHELGTTPSNIPRCSMQRPRFQKYAVPAGDKPDDSGASNKQLDGSQGSPVAPLFPYGEFPARLAKLRKTMQEESIDITILTSIHNIKYFSNFFYCQFGRTYALVVSQTHVTLLTAGIDSFGPQRMIRHNGHENQSHIVYTDWNKWNYFEALKASVPGFCEAKRIGCEADHMNCKVQEIIRDYCFADEGSEAEVMERWSGPPQAVEVASAPAKAPKVTFLDVSAKLMQHRLVKSAGEIKLIRRACEIANEGCDALIAALTTGRSESEVAHEGVAKMKSLINSSFPTTEMCDTWVWFQSGVCTDGAHNAVTTRRLEPFDILSFNCFPMIDGYYVALERTGVFIGKETAEMQVPSLAKLLEASSSEETVSLREFHRVACETDLAALRSLLFVDGDLPEDGVAPIKPSAAAKGAAVNPKLLEVLSTQLLSFLFNIYYWKINVLVFETGRDLIKPGKVLKDIALELNDIYASYNVLALRTFGYGHSFGVLCHYYGRETIMEIREDNMTVLEAGMVISMEPQITIPADCFGAGGYREHDILLLKEDCQENITGFKYGPRDMCFY